MQNRSKFIAAALGAATLATGGLGAASAHADAILTGNFGDDNYGFVYISTSATSLGTLIGSTATWNPAAALTATRLFGGMTYYINVEAINGDPGATVPNTNHLPGGFIGDFSLSGAGTFSNGGTELLTGTTGWKGSYNNDNYQDTATTWLAPTGSIGVEGANGTGPYGTISGISSSASWIWSTDALAENGTASGDQCADCTIDFQTVITTAVPEPSSWTVMLMGLAGLAGALGIRRKKVAHIG